MQKPIANHSKMQAVHHGKLGPVGAETQTRIPEKKKESEAGRLIEYVSEKNKGYSLVVYSTWKKGK
jgi:hypothetical protein